MRLVDSKAVVLGLSVICCLLSTDCFGFLPVHRHAFKFALPTFLGSRPKNDDEGDASSPRAREIGIGIDLGTTFSAVAYLKDSNSPTIIPIPQNGRTMPSLVTLRPGDAEPLVGKEAAMYLDTEPYCNVKRILGTGGKISQESLKVVPFLRPCSVGKTFKKDSLLNQLADAQEHPTMLLSSINSTELIRPETISAYILKKLKDTAEAHTGCKVTRAVIGVPAYFHDEQREATKRAARIAGIEKVKLLREPEAAAFAYGIGKQQVAKSLGDDDDDDELVLVFDLGGGTFDVSMLLVGGGVAEIISTAGNAQLGGTDFDARIADHFRKLLAAHGSSTKGWSESSITSVMRAAEASRIYLSNNKNLYLALPIKEEDWRQMNRPTDVFLISLSNHEGNITEAGKSNSTHVLCLLSRRNVEILCREELQALLKPVREVAIMAGALLPGDTSPTMLEAALEMDEEDNSYSSLVFEDFYSPDGKGPAQTDGDLLLQLQEADMKAAKKAQQRGRKKARNVAKEERKYRQEKRKIATKGDMGGGYVDGIKVRDGIAGRPISRVVLVGGATRMPAVGRLVAALTGIVPQKTVNPDEAVALGCAVHVGVLDGAENMGTVLNPMQAAILRAVARQQGFGQGDDDFDADFDDAYFEEVELY